MAQTPAPNGRRRLVAEPVIPPSEETQEVGFEGAFAPPPPPVTGSAEVSDRPMPPVFTGPANVPLGAPTPFVRIVHNQVGPYPAGHVVPAVAFENLQRLLDLGAVVYDRDALIASEPDQNILAARNVAMPVGTSQTIPRAPWVQSSAADLLGPAVPHLAQSGGFNIVQGEHGQQLLVAQPPAAPPQEASQPLAEDELAPGVEQQPPTRPEPLHYR